LADHLGVVGRGAIVSVDLREVDEVAQKTAFSCGAVDLDGLLEVMVAYADAHHGLGDPQQGGHPPVATLS
jgi:hypothetical protein